MENVNSNSLSIVISLILAVISIAGYYRIFEKAGEKGWKAIIPVYNLYIMFKITFGKGIMFLLLLIPVVNVVFDIWYAVKLAKVFDRGVGTIIGIIFVPFVFIPILGFGKAEYKGISDQKEESK